MVKFTISNSSRSKILKFSTWRARNTFYQHRKLFNFVVSPDLTSRRESVLSFAREEINGGKGDDMAAVKKIVDFAFCDINCKLQFKSRLNKFYMFSSSDEFLEIVYRLNHEICSSDKFLEDENRRINISEEESLRTTFSINEKFYVVFLFLIV